MSIFPNYEWRFHADMWHVPVLAKYRLLRRATTPFGSAGVSFRRGNMSGNALTTTIGLLGVIESGRTEFKENHTDTGWVVGF